VRFGYYLLLGGVVMAAWVTPSSAARGPLHPAWRDDPLSGSPAAFCLQATATLPWAKESAPTAAPMPVISNKSTEPGNCSTFGQGETCSVGNGGGAGSSCSTFGTTVYYCTAWADQGPGGLCSAGVSGGGASGEFCSTNSGSGSCSVIGDQGRGSCSATGDATCSSDALFSSCTAFASSGSLTACSVTEGSGGSCTEGVSGFGSCSTMGAGAGHCSSWTSGGSPVDDGDVDDVCDG
jgi:hypothetical protein